MKNIKKVVKTELAIIDGLLKKFNKGPVSQQVLVNVYGPHAVQVLLKNSIIGMHLKDESKPGRMTYVLQKDKLVPPVVAFNAMLEAMYLTDAVAVIIDGCADIKSLGEECREMVDNVSCTGLENTQRIQTLGETADTLENLDEPEAVEMVDRDGNEIDPILVVILPDRSHRTGRGHRRDSACGSIRSAVDAILEWCEQDKEKDDNDIRSELRSSLEQLCVEAEEICDESEGLEFPGMYG